MAVSASQDFPKVWDARSCSCLNLTCPYFFLLRALFWSVKWLQLYSCKSAARQGSGFFHTKEHFMKSTHVPASITYSPWLGEPGCLGGSRASAVCIALLLQRRSLALWSTPLHQRMSVEWEMSQRIKFSKTFAVQLLLERIWFLQKQIEL